MDRLEADGAEVRRTGRSSCGSGVDPLTAVEFTLDDLIGATVLPEQSALEGGRCAVLAR